MSSKFILFANKNSKCILHIQRFSEILTTFGRMTIETYIPTSTLRPYVKEFHVIESHSTPLENRVLPGTGIALAFRFGGDVFGGEEGQQTIVPGASLAGLRQSARLINYRPYAGTLVAVLQAGMAPVFLREPLYEAKGLTLDLDNFFTPSEIAKVQDQLFEVDHHHVRIAIVERFLLAKLRPQAADPMVIHAVAAIHRAGGRLPIAQLASDSCLSQDAFEKRFRKTVGISPKPFAEIVRLTALVGAYRPRQPMLRLALEGGYFDQAHFNRAFKRFSGLAPRQFFGQSRFW